VPARAVPDASTFFLAAQGPIPASEVAIFVENTFNSMH